MSSQPTATSQREAAIAPLVQLAAAQAAQSERLVAWLRLLAIALIGAGQGFGTGSPSESGFREAILSFSFWALCLLVWVYVRPVTSRFTLLTTAADVAAITALAILSGGAFSQARLAYFLVPIAVAFRFQPRYTAAALLATLSAYLGQALADSAAARPEATHFILVQIGYQAWLGLAAVLLSYVLGRRTQRVMELAATRQRLVAEALSAADRERKRLAEGLHDHAVQNLLSARHELQEVAETVAHPALPRADAALVETLAQLRRAVFELHPYVLEQAGLEAAMRAIGEEAVRRAGLRLHLDVRAERSGPHDALVFAVARELLANVVQHAHAANLWVRLDANGRRLVLSIEDDGCGFDPEVRGDRVSQGHIGLVSQQERVETAGGSLRIRTAPGAGTVVEVTLPLEANDVRSRWHGHDAAGRRDLLSIEPYRPLPVRR